MVAAWSAQAALTNTAHWLLTQQEFVFSQFWSWEVRDQGASRVGFWWGPSSWLAGVPMWPYAHVAFPRCLHPAGRTGSGREGGSSLVALPIRTVIPRSGLCLPGLHLTLITSYRSHLQILSHCSQGIEKRILWKCGQSITVANEKKNTFSISWLFSEFFLLVWADSMFITSKKSASAPSLSSREGYGGEARLGLCRADLPGLSTWLLGPRHILVKGQHPVLPGAKNIRKEYWMKGHQDRA